MKFFFFFLFFFFPPSRRDDTMSVACLNDFDKVSFLLCFPEEEIMAEVFCGKLLPLFSLFFFSFFTIH